MSARYNRSARMQHKLVGLYSKNRWEVVVADQSCNAYSLVSVPLYDTLGAEAAAFICSQTQMHTVFAAHSEVDKVLNLKAQFPDKLAALGNVVQFEDVGEEQKAAASAVGLRLLSFSEVAAAGAAHPAPHQPPKPSQLAFLCYTSGTTGMPKGVMITHQNMVADAGAAEFAQLGLSGRDVYLSYLPL